MNNMEAESVRPSTKINTVTLDQLITAGLLLYKKIAELRAYECSAPGQETGVKNRRWERTNMKREFLEGLNLEKEAIDQIMAENGRDIEAEKAKVTAAEADRDKYKEQLETATTELEKFKDVDPEEFKTTVENLKAELKAKDEEYAAKEADRLFKDSVREAITAAGGKNEKAVMALLDLETLKGSNNQKDDIKTALEAVKKENDYLFTSKEPIDNPANPTGPTGGGGGAGATSALRAAMGLPDEKK